MRQDTNSSFNQPSSNIRHILSGVYFWFFCWDRTAINCMTSSCCLVVIVYSVTLPPYSTCPYTASPQCWTHIVLLLLVICCLLVWHHVSRTNERRCEKTGKKPGTRCCSLSGKMPKSNTHTVSEMGREMLADSSNICKEREAKSSKKNTSTALQQSGPGLCSGAASAERE